MHGADQVVNNQFFESSAERYEWFYFSEIGDLIHVHHITCHVPHISLGLNSGINL